MAGDVIFAPRTELSTVRQLDPSVAVFLVNMLQWSVVCNPLFVLKIKTGNLAEVVTFLCYPIGSEAEEDLSCRLICHATFVAPRDVERFENLKQHLLTSPDVVLSAGISQDQKLHILRTMLGHANTATVMRLFKMDQDEAKQANCMVNLLSVVCLGVSCPINTVVKLATKCFFP